MTKLQRFCLIWTLINLLLFCTACGGWISQANSLIPLISAAISSIVSIISLFAKLPASTAAVIQQATNSAQDMLMNVVKPAIEAYDNAAADVKATLLSKILATLQSVASTLTTTFTDLAISDQTVKDRVTALVGLVMSLLTALIGIVPVIKAMEAGEHIDHHELAAKTKAVPKADQWRCDFNSVAGTFGSQFEI